MTPLRPHLALLLLLASACASEKSAERTGPPPVRPLAHSSISAVLVHRGDLGLTDDQVRSLELLDSELQRANGAIVTALKEAQERKKSGGPPVSTNSGNGSGGGGGGMGGGMGGRGGGMHGGGGGGGRGGGGRHPPSEDQKPQSPLEHAIESMDNNDARALQDSEAFLTDPQKPRAEEYAEKYREQLYDWREAVKKQGGAILP